MERKLTPIDPESPSSIKPPAEKPKPPKQRTMRELNAAMDRVQAELKAAANVYRYIDHMLKVIKQEIIVLKTKGTPDEVQTQEEAPQHTEDVQEGNSEPDVRTKTAPDGDGGI